MCQLVRSRNASFISVIALAALAGAGCLGSPDEAGAQEPSGEVAQPIVLGGHDYRFFTTPKKWVDAATVCLNMGAHLVAIESASEENFLASEEAAHGGGTWWIGLNDTGDASEGNFRWENGSQLGFVNFAPGQPDNQGNSQDCVYDGFTNGQWDDFNCNAQLKFVCEMDSVPTGNISSFTYPPVSNTNSALQNVTAFAFSLAPGRGIQIGTCGLPGASHVGDTFLRVYGPTAQQIAFNDDACLHDPGDHHGSNLTVAAVTGTQQTYIVRAGCFANAECSGTVVLQR